jgi:glycosyltransferase involved in cell wall biosynthesis
MLSFLFVDTELVWRGGQDQLFTLMRGLRQRGHPIHLACPSGTMLVSRSKEEGITHHSLRVRSEAGLCSFMRLTRILWKTRPNVLAFNTPRPILIGNLASTIIPVDARIIFRRVHFALKDNILTRLKYTWKVDRIITISDAIKLQLQKGGIPSDKIQTIYEGIDLPAFPRLARTQSQDQDKPAVIGVVAHLSREKGVNFLIEAASMIPDARKRVRFVFVGDGTCLSELKELAQKTGMPEIFHFAGFQSNAWEFLKTFDIFALPSLSEGLSSAILEAMAASLPVVASRTGGIPEIVKDGKNGLLVAPGNPAELARAIERLINDPEEAGRMGSCGREIIEQQFTMERKIQETERLCRSLVHANSHGAADAD